MRYQLSSVNNSSSKFFKPFAVESPNCLFKTSPVGEWFSYDSGYHIY